MTKYVVEIPDDVRMALEERALAAGSDVPQVIQRAVVSFVRDSVPASTVGRLPDPPIESPEILAPCDLPRNDPRPIDIQRASRRVPDFESQAESLMSQRVRAVGRLTAVRDDAKAFNLVLDDGRQVEVQCVGDLTVVAGLTDERVLVLGTAIYSSTGNFLRVDADNIARSSDDSDFFSVIPPHVSPSFDLDDVLHDQQHKPGLSAIIGQWPGNESDEEVAAALRELS